jgi:hypothetical protein
VVVVLVGLILEEVLTLLDAERMRRCLLTLEIMPDGGRRRPLPLGLVTSQLVERRHHPHSLVDLVGRAAAL